MPDLDDGETIEMQGSGSKPYVLKNIGGVYSCTCPAWRNQSLAIEQRTCKHLRKLRGDAAEEARVGGAPARAAPRSQPRSRAGPPLLLAESWDGDADLTGWWMSEKLDGVRAYWDGKQFLSRQGNRLHAPDWFVGRPARRAARRRAVARPQDVPAHRQHRPPPGQERPLEGDPLRRLRRPGRGRAVRGAAGVRRRDARQAAGRRYALAARARRCARTSTICGRSWPASRRWAAKG